MNPPSEPPSMAGSFSRKEINQLRDICPNIQSLTIDIEAENYKVIQYPSCIVFMRVLEL